MIIDTDSKSLQAFTKNFEEKVVACKSFYGKEKFKHFGQYIGAIEGNEFWVLKMDNYFSLLSHRRFCGQIIEDEDDIFVQGQFKTDSEHMLFFAIWIVGAMLWILWRVRNGIPKGLESIFFFFFIVMVVLFCIAAHYGIDRCMNKRFDDAVVEFIKQL